MFLAIMESTYPITYVRKRVRYIRITIRRHGEVVVSVPWQTPLSHAEAFVAEKKAWIERTRQRIMAQPQRSMQAISPEQQNTLTLYLHQAVEYWRGQMNEAPIHWRIKNMKSMWGNCRYRERLLTFNLQLALQPKEAIDYIIVHELAHLKVHNHGHEFHQWVQQFIPNEKEIRQQMRGKR